MGIGFGTNGRSGIFSASEFDDFLTASIGEERNGRLSVISMLGRLNIDPWREAVQLASSPRPAATRRLASLIESLPGHVMSAADATAIAAKLVARLPIRGTAPKSPGISAGAAGAAGKSLVTGPWMVIMAAGLALWLCTELMSDKQRPPSPEAPTTNTDRP